MRKILGIAGIVFASFLPQESLWQIEQGQAFKEAGASKIAKEAVAVKKTVRSRKKKKMREPVIMQTDLPNDSLFYRQWFLNNKGDFKSASSKPKADMDMLEAWKIEQGDSGVVVAVLDGGCNLNERDLQGRIWQNTDEIPDNFIDDDGNGYVDDVNGWDFVDDDNFPQDETGHGTNVAGIIGAKANNGTGYAGVDWNCKMMVLKVTASDGNGLYMNWIKAIRYAVDNGARVINMSVGGEVQSVMLQKAVDYAYAHDVVIVASMMNYNTGKKYFPAACRNVIAVGSTDPDDTRSSPFFWDSESGSNYGSHISVVAPGNYIFGLSPKGYNVYWGGTSQAAPMVAGMAALLIAQDPDRNVDDIRRLIETSADDLVGLAGEDKPGWDPYYGHGRINVGRALRMGRDELQRQAAIANVEE